MTEQSESTTQSLNALLERIAMLEQQVLELQQQLVLAQTELPLDTNGSPHAPR